jgi:hypothetical protein
MLSSEKIESSRIPSSLFLLSTIFLTAATRTILKDKHTAEDYQRELESESESKPKQEPEPARAPAGAKAPASILSPIPPKMDKESTSNKSELEEILDHLDSLFTNDLIKEKIASIDRYIDSNNFSTLNDLNNLNKELNKYGITVLSNSISILPKINDEARSEESNLEELLYNLENISVINTQMMMDILGSIDAAIESKEFSNLGNHGITITPDTNTININISSKK